MKPQIQGTKFGSITVGGETLDCDVVIDFDGKVEKRKKSLSRKYYGNSHTISQDEAKHIFKKGAKQLILGTGQHDMVRLSKEARHYLEKHACRAVQRPTPEAVRAWNEAKGKTIAMFHVTC